ncbi:MAG TPA: polysaccharide biosynthesis C-terminal domain-containing protein [Planctomycetota bacterium]|nr:polysaccharide biosynthesis C-terminal domain-containing protein [Planctomycetota bacterium]
MSGGEQQAGTEPPAPGALRGALGRLGKHTLIYAITGQLSRLVGFLLIPFYTSWLTTADYGVNELLSQLIAVLSYVAGINLTTAMARYYFEQQDEAGRREVVSTTLLAVLAGAVGVAGLLALGAEPLAALLSADDPGLPLLVRLTLAILVLQMLRETWLRYLQAQQRSLAYGAVSVGKVLVEVSLQIWFVAHEGLGLAGVFYGVLLGEAASVAALTALLLPRVGLRFSRPVFGLMFAYALPLIPNGILQFCLHSADRFVLEGLAGTEQVGLYAFAYKFGYIPNYLLITPFLLIWYPFVFSLRDEARQRDLIATVAPWLMGALTAVVLAEALFAREVARLMAGSDEFVEGWRAIGLVCAGYWFWGLFQLLQTGFYVRKATGRLPALTGLAVAVNFAVNFALIPRLGFMGAAWATLLSFIALAFVTGRAVQPVFPVPWPWRRIMVPAVGAAAVYAAGASLGPVAGLQDGAAQTALKLALLVGWAAWIRAGGFLRRS